MAQQIINAKERAVLEEMSSILEGIGTDELHDTCLGGN